MQEMEMKNGLKLLNRVTVFILVICFSFPQTGFAVLVNTSTLRSLSSQKSIKEELSQRLSAPVRKNTILMATGGGDCAGLNSAIAYVIRELDKRGLSFCGVKEAFKGLSSREFEDYLEPLGPEDEAGLIGLASTQLLSSRKNPFEKGNEAELAQMVKNLAGGLITDRGVTVSIDDILDGQLVTQTGHRIDMRYLLQGSKEDVDSGILYDIDGREVPIEDTYDASVHTKKGIISQMANAFRGIIISGGNDHSTIAWKLHLIGIRPVISIPKSIDNDFRTQMLGFHTAYMKARRDFWSNAISALTHRRTSVFEIMGRNAGWLALRAAQKFPEGFSKLPRTLKDAMTKARDSVMILVPEKPTSLESIIRKAVEIIEKNKCLNIMVSEGFSVSKDDPIIVKLLILDEGLAGEFKKIKEVDSFGNPKLTGVHRYIRGLIEYLPQLVEFIGDKDLIDRVKALNEAGYLRSSRPNMPGFIYRGLPPGKYDEKLAEVFAKKAVELIADGYSGLTVTLPEGASPFKDEPVALPAGEVIPQKTLTTEISDKYLRKQGVFWQNPEDEVFAAINTEIITVNPEVRPRPRAVLFDFDGTLVDTLQLQEMAFGKMYYWITNAKPGEPTDEEIIPGKRFLHDTMGGLFTEQIEIIVKKAFENGRSEEELLEVFRILAERYEIPRRNIARAQNNLVLGFAMIYEAVLLDGIKCNPPELLPGVRGFLDYLRAHDIPMYVGTGTAQGIPELVVEKLGIHNYFKDIYGVVIEGPALFPHGKADILRRIKQELGIHYYRQIIIFGDGKADMAASKHVYSRRLRNKFIAVGITGDRKELAQRLIESGADFLIPGLQDWRAWHKELGFPDATVSFSGIKSSAAGKAKDISAITEKLTQPTSALVSAEAAKLDAAILNAAVSAYQKAIEQMNTLKSESAQKAAAVAEPLRVAEASLGLMNLSKDVAAEEAKIKQVTGTIIINDAEIPTNQKILLTLLDKESNYLKALEEKLGCKVRLLSQFDPDIDRSANMIAISRTKIDSIPNLRYINLKAVTEDMYLPLEQVIVFAKGLLVYGIDKSATTKTAISSIYRLLAKKPIQKELLEEFLRPNGVFMLALPPPLPVDKKHYQDLHKQAMAALIAA